MVLILGTADEKHWARTSGVQRAGALDDVEAEEGVLPEVLLLPDPRNCGGLCQPDLGLLLQLPPLPPAPLGILYMLHHDSNMFRIQNSGTVFYSGPFLIATNCLFRMQNAQRLSQCPTQVPEVSDWPHHMPLLRHAIALYKAFAARRRPK